MPPLRDVPMQKKEPKMPRKYGREVEETVLILVAETE
jgi:hypothetical protein